MKKKNQRCLDVIKGAVENRKVGAKVLEDQFSK